MTNFETNIGRMVDLLNSIIKDCEDKKARARSTFKAWLLNEHEKWQSQYNGLSGWRKLFFGKDPCTLEGKKNSYGYWWLWNETCLYDYLRTANKMINKMKSIKMVLANPSVESDAKMKVEVSDIVEFIISDFKCTELTGI